MRLSNPVYESVPAVYAAIGAIGFVLAYLDREDPWSSIALCIGLAGEVAALTIFLRRQDYRASSREYSGAHMDLMSHLKSDPPVGG